MTRAMKLSDLKRDEREAYLWHVFRECEDYRLQKENEILEVFRFVRGLPDKDTKYRNDLRHPYAFAAYQTIKAQVYPVLFASDPVAQIKDPNPANYERNQVAERLLTSMIHNPYMTNFALAFDRLLDDAIWFGYSAPWTYFRSRSKTFEGRIVNVPNDSGGFTAQRLDPTVERVYHAPWLEHVDVWDTFLHPDARRGYTRRDATGYELLEVSRGANPIYDPDRVLAMVRREMGVLSRKTRESSPDFHAGSESFMRRDQLAAEVGAEPLRHDELQTSLWAKDILAKPYVLLHYDDGEYSGTYAVASDRSGLMELRFNVGVNYDGESNRILLTTGRSPQEVYGTSIFSIGLPLFKLHSKFYQAAADITALTMNPMWTVSQQFQTMGNQIVVGPGAVIPVPGSGQHSDHVKRLDMPQSSFVPVGFTGNLQRDLDLLTAQSNPIRGVAEGGRKTALETSLLAQGASGRTDILHTRIVNEFGVPLFRKWLAMAGEHFTRRDYVEMLGHIGADYIPPARREILRGLQFVPKGSVTGADRQLRQARWGNVMGVLTQTLPVINVPHIHEAVKRMMEDMGFEAVSRMIPDLNDPRMTEFMATTQRALAVQQQLGGGGAGAQAPPAALGPGGNPRSPGDISTLLRQNGGAQAPPGPPDGGRLGNGQAQRFAG